MKNSGQFKGGDPFLAKLQEIDRDLQKFDNLVGKNPCGDNVVVEKSSLQSLNIHPDYGFEFLGIIKAGVVNNSSCDKVQQIKGPTKDLGLSDGTLAYFELLAGPKLVTPTIPHLSPYVIKPRDPFQDISNCFWPSSKVKSKVFHTWGFNLIEPIHSPLNEYIWVFAATK